MGRKLTLKSEFEEELIEAVSFYSNFVDDLDEIIELIDSNETLDLQNDKIRNEGVSFLLKGLESYSARAYEDVDRCMHAAIQKLHSQELLDFKDNNPRAEAKVKLAISRQKALHHKEVISKFLKKMQEKGEGIC